MTQDNETWGNLPKEILNLVVRDCGRDCQKVKWMFVNRKWFDFYLSLVYRSISINLDSSDKKIKKIMSSPFKIGNKVKHINFSTFTLPKSIDNWDISADCLSVLMKETQNVEEIGFLREESWSHQGWAYFSVVLLNTDYWKLRTLPKINHCNVFFSSHYYSCAYRMRHTLVELDLTIGMVGTLDFKILKDFTALERLKINEKVVNGVDELELLLRYTPKLKEAVVDFANDRFETFQSEFNEQKGFSFSTLKNLKLCNFTPKHNNELLIFVTENFMLDKLHIIGEKNSQWPTAQVESHIIDIFFDALHTIHEYEITIPGNMQGTVFMKRLNSMMNDLKQKTHLSIIYVKKDIGVVVTIKGGKSKAATTLVYEIGREYDRNLSEAVNILSNMGDNVSQVIIGGITDNIKMLTEALSEKNQVNLKELTVTDSLLYTYSSSNTTLLEIQYIKRLKFSKCKLKFDVIKSFTKEFQSLDYVQLDNCSFEGDSTKELIDMSETRMGTVHMSNCRKMLLGNWHRPTSSQNITIVLLRLSTFNGTNYYMIVEEGTVKVTKAAFDVFYSKFSSNEALILNIGVQSIKQLLLQPTESSKEIRIDFPQWQ